MVEIESFLRSKSGEFTPIKFSDTSPLDDRHVEGAIDLTINGTPIIERSMWDDVDQLWAYIVDMVDSLESTGRGYTYFPDQPISLSFERTGTGKVLVSLTLGDKNRKAVVDEGELVGTLKRSALDFFSKMLRLLPANANTYRDLIDKIGEAE